MVWVYIFLAFGLSVLWFLGLSFYLIRRYARRLEYIRDRMDLTTASGRAMTRYINNELDIIMAQSKKKKNLRKI